MEANVPTVGTVQGSRIVTAAVEITQEEYDALHLLADSYLDSMTVVIERCGGPYADFIESVVTPIKKFAFRELESDYIDLDLELRANQDDEDMAPEHPGG